MKILPYIFLSTFLACGGCASQSLEAKRIEVEFIGEKNSIQENKKIA